MCRSLRGLNAKYVVGIFVDFNSAFYFVLWEGQEVVKNRLPGNLVFGVDVFERERERERIEL